MRNFAKENGCEESWETFVVKPGGVLQKDRVRSLNWALPQNGIISEYFPSSFRSITKELIVADRV